MMNRLKTLAVFLLALPLIAIMSPARAAVGDEDFAATYKAKCAMCHGAKAEKAFDAAKGDEALADSVLKGISPRMPKYEGKLTADQAKGLVAYMKSLR